MKVFQTIRMHLAVLGFQENLQPFNGRQIFCCVQHAVGVISFYVHLFHVASTTEEYMDSIFMTAIASFMIISHISVVLKMKTIFLFFNEVEEVMNSSEC